MKIKTLALSTLFALSALTATTVAVADDDYLEMKAQQSAKITYEKAQSIAVEAVGGGIVVDVDFDLDFRGAHYEVEVIFNNVKYDVKVDANTGKVLSKKIDY